MFGGLFDQNVLLFTVPALLGTAVFLLKLGLMMLTGIGGDVDAPTDADLDLDAGVDLGEAAESGDSTEAFNLLSIQSIAAFLMGFGWGGYAGLRGFGWDATSSSLLGIAFGAALVWLLGWLMKMVYDLQSSGNIRIHETVGAKGTVYANVPARGQGSGQVRIVVKDRQRIYNAVSEGDPIATGSGIRVVGANENNTLTVTTV